MTIYQPKSNEEEISLCFQDAIKRLDKVDADAEKEKRQIVRDLAKDLEGKIPTNRIANEIVHQLYGKKISPRMIRKCLDEKYKEKHRVENARKQKRKYQSTKDLAASVPLNYGNIDQQEKKVVIDTLGNKVAESQPSIIKGTDYGDNGKEVIAQSNRRDVTESENCKIKDSRIKELEVVDQIAKDGVEQLENEIRNLQGDLEEMTFLNAKLSDDLKLLKELQADKNLNMPAVYVTSTGDFEFSFLLGEIRYYLASLSTKVGDGGEVWFTGKFDKDTGKFLSIKFRRIDGNSNV